jgi:hypothetical protein
MFVFCALHNPCVSFYDILNSLESIGISQIFISAIFACFQDLNWILLVKINEVSVGNYKEHISTYINTNLCQKRFFNFCM